MSDLDDALRRSGERIRIAAASHMIGGPRPDDIVLTLDEVSLQRVVHALADPPPPNARLRTAMERYAREVESRD